MDRKLYVISARGSIPVVGQAEVIAWHDTYDGVTDYLMDLSEIEAASYEEEENVVEVDAMQDGTFRDEGEGSGYVIVENGSWRIAESDEDEDGGN